MYIFIESKNLLFFLLFCFFCFSKLENKFVIHPVGTKSIQLKKIVQNPVYLLTFFYLGILSIPSPSTTTVRTSPLRLSPRGSVSNSMPSSPSGGATVQITTPNTTLVGPDGARKVFSCYDLF